MCNKSLKLPLNTPPISIYILWTKQSVSAIASFSLLLLITTEQEVEMAFIPPAALVMAGYTFVPLAGPLSSMIVDLVAYIAPSQGWMIGFTPSGPAARSIASTAHSYIGAAVPAGSNFSNLQRVAMTPPAAVVPLP